MPRVRLDDRQVNALVNKMVEQFNRNTGLNMDSKMILSYINAAQTADMNRVKHPGYDDATYIMNQEDKTPEVDAKIEDNYKAMYKDVLTNVMMDAKKRVLNPMNRQAPKKGQDYKARKSAYLKQIKNDRETFQNKTYFASEEFNAFMDNLYGKVYAPMLKNPLYADNGGLDRDDFVEISMAAHTDEIEYEMASEKMFGNGSKKAAYGTRIMLEKINQFNGSYYNGYEKQDGNKYVYNDEGASFYLDRPRFIEEPTEDERIAGKVAKSYLLLLNQHKSRFFISRFFHFKENQALSGMRNVLRTMLGNPHYTNDELEDIMKSSLSKQANSNCSNFEAMAKDITSIDGKDLQPRFDSYRKLAEDTIEKNKPIEVDVKEMDNNTANKFKAFARGEITQEKLMDNIQVK